MPPPPKNVLYGSCTDNVLLFSNKIHKLFKVKNAPKSVLCFKNTNNLLPHKADQRPTTKQRVIQCNFNHQLLSKSFLTIKTG